MNLGKKRRKSKEFVLESINPLEISTNSPPNKNRSASAVFTPSQMKATYSFRTIEEEPDDIPLNSPRFVPHHSTPIFNHSTPMFNSQHSEMNNLYISATPENTELDIPLTPDLPPTAPPAFTHQISHNIHERSSLPLQKTQNSFKSRYNQQNQRSSLPPRNGQQVTHGHMQANSQLNITVPQFGFDQAQSHQTVHYQSLQNIHEQQKAQNMMYPQQQQQYDLSANRPRDGMFNIVFLNKIETFLIYILSETFLVKREIKNVSD